MSEWQDVKVTDPTTGQTTIVNKEVGLAPGQTGGYVGGTYVERPAGVDDSIAYTPGKIRTEVKIERNQQGRPTRFNLYRYDQYGNLMSIGEQTAGRGNPIVNTQASHINQEQVDRYNQLQQQILYNGGWQVGNKIFADEQAAKNDIQRMQAISNIPRASGAATPQQFILQQKGYKPVVTVEGTTVYTKTNNQDVQEVYVPKYGKMIPAEEYWRQNPTPFMKAQSAFNDYEKQLAENLKLKEIIDPAIAAYKHAQFLAEYDPKYQKYGGKQSELGKEASDYAIGMVEGIRDKPLTAAGNVAFALLVTKGLGALPVVPGITAGLGAGAIASRVSLVNALGVGLATAYGIDVSGRYAEAPNKAEFLGKLTSTELAPFIVGGYLGSKPLPKIPYSIGRGKPAGVLFEIKNMYSVPDEYFAGKALTVNEPGITPEKGAIFASKTKGGLTDIYLRPVRATAEEWLSKLQGHAEYVNTQYGSYLNIRATGLKTIQDYKLLQKTRTPGRMEVNDFLNNPIKDVWHIKDFLTPVFEKMGVNIAELGGNDFKVKFVSAKSLPNDVRARYYSDSNTIELRRGSTGKDVIYDISHEIGHAVTKGGTFGLAPGEASATSFERRFIETFNNLYKTTYNSKVSFKFVLEHPGEYSVGTYIGNKIQSIGRILKSEYKLSTSPINKVKEIFESVGESISKQARIERKLDISPAHLRMVEEANRIGLNAINWDYDIAADILRPGKGNMRSEPFGGLVKAAPVRSQLAVETRAQLTTPSPKTRLPVAWTIKQPSSPGEFKSLFDEKSAELADYARNIFKDYGVKVATVTQVKPTRTTPIITMPRTATQTRTQTQTAEQIHVKRVLQVVDRVDKRITDIEKMFNQQAIQTRRAIRIDRSQFPSRKPTSSIQAVYNLFDNEGIADKRKPTPRAYNLPAGFIQPGVSPKPSPKPYPQPRPQTKTQPQTKPRPSTKPATETARPRTPRQPDIPTSRIIPPLKPKEFTDEIDSRSKRKNKGRYVWNIKNPVPTLESVLK